jgi:molybdenum cofactor synthesis domain-containing protein
MLTAAIITASDKGFKNQRQDLSGQLIKEMLVKEGYDVLKYIILPDDFEMLKNEMIYMADRLNVNLILTTGGTGFSVRDITPEATNAVIQRQVPGIPEAIRYNSLKITSRAMLSRAACGIRGQTLIINLPGSPKAVKESLEFVIEPIKHGLEILLGSAGECAR